MKIEIPELTNYAETNNEVANQMVESLWNRYCNDQGSTSLPYWIDKFTSEKQANRMVLALAKAGIITTTVKTNWAEIELNENYLLSKANKEELNDLIRTTKLAKYMPQTAEMAINNPVATSTKLTSGIKESGLARFGFAEAGQKHSFKYDVNMMTKYKTEIIAYSVKSMKKMEKQLGKSLRLPANYDYQSLIEQTIDLIIANPDTTYILGKLTNDSRGRAIYECLRTIFNPLANKMARALVVTPATKVTKEGIRNAYLCIAELRHGFNSSIFRKVRCGRRCHEERSFHELNLTGELSNDFIQTHNESECILKKEELKEKAIDELHENIWLERLYNEFDQLAINPDHLVTTPLEVDFSSSNMVMIGLLLGHSDYIDHTSYMWQMDGLTKQHVKFAQTPYVFGSSASVKTLWTKNNLTFTDEQIRIMKKAQTTGKFAIANELKDIIINYCTPTATMNLCVQREEFTVECNKTKNVGDLTKQYVVYDSTTNKFKVIKHTNTHTVPDLQQFKRYFMTGLIHNLDSQVLDNIVLGMDWILPIHDAGIVTWEGATTMRNRAVREMQDVLDNRKETMVNYLTSIGLTNKGWIKYAKLLEKVEEANIGKKIELSPYLLK